jgi:hypothetical protein
MMVAVGFNPRFSRVPHEGSRRGATPETALPFGPRPHQASRRDASFISPLEPWVETHGYPPESLRDLEKPTRAEHQARNRSPELCIKTKPRAPDPDVISARSAALKSPAHPDRIYAPAEKKSLSNQRLTHILPSSTLPDITS